MKYIGSITLKTSVRKTGPRFKGGRTSVEDDKRNAERVKRYIYIYIAGRILRNSWTVKY